MSETPDPASQAFNQGLQLRAQGRLPEAEAALRQALALRPGHPLILNNLAIVLSMRGRQHEAVAAFRQAIATDPANADAHANLGAALKYLADLAGAEAALRQAVALNPRLVEAHNNLGVILKDQGRFEAAEACYRQALAVAPDFLEARGNLLFAQAYAARRSPAEHLEEARAYGRVVAARAQPFGDWTCEPEPARLKVGLVSGDLRDHSVGHFLEGVLEHLDPARIELCAYPTLPAESPLTARIRPRFSIWRPIPALNDAAAAAAIRDDGVHVLIDLSGHTRGNRLPLFAWRPAPAQATWLGYFATTGVAEIDYLLGDPRVTPPDEASHFVEEPWPLPQSWVCFTPPRLDIDVGPLPAAAGEGITFGSLNSLTKVTDAVVATWARVLAAVPGSRLLLHTRLLRAADIREATRARFVAAGVEPTRLVLEGDTSREAFLAAYNRIDIALDPFPCPGGTISAEAVWMGVPVLTLRGDRFLSHMGESLCRSLGLPGWIAADADDYVAKAVAHADDLGGLAALRAGLRDRALASPLFDAARFARDLEGALWGMWRAKRP